MREGVSPRPSHLLKNSVAEDFNPFRDSGHCSVQLIVLLGYRVHEGVNLMWRFNEHLLCVGHCFGHSRECVNAKVPRRDK